MEEFGKMSNEQLTDLLAEKTNHYMKMFREGAKHKEFYDCKTMIDRLTAEIKQRKERAATGKKRR